MSYSVDRGEDVFHPNHDTNAMTETELLLKQAADIARAVFSEPSESAVLEVFRRLAIERDEVVQERDMASALH